jgi:hypothetical protein
MRPRTCCGGGPSADDLATGLPHQLNSSILFVNVLAAHQLNSGSVPDVGEGFVAGFGDAVELVCRGKG